MGKNIKTLRRFLALVMAFGVVAGLCACTQQSSSSAPPSATSSESQTPDAVVAEWPDFLTVGGGSTGGVFFSAAAGIAQLLSSETDTTATAQTTTGGSQNIQLIANGEMELGIAAADACYQAWNGIGSYEKPLQEMNVICAIYSSYYQHVVRNDSKAQSFEEMAGSTQVVGGSGSGTEVSARAVLGAYGYDYLERKDLKAEFLGISEGVEKIQNKQADGMNSITPYPFSSFVELTMTDNAHLISINDEALDKLVNAEGSVYMKGIIPAGTYNNQNEDIHAEQRDTGVNNLLQRRLRAGQRLDCDIIHTLLHQGLDGIDLLFRINIAIQNGGFDLGVFRGSQIFKRQGQVVAPLIGKGRTGETYLDLAGAFRGFRGLGGVAGRFLIGLGAAGDQGQHHDRCQERCKSFLQRHIFFLLKNNEYVFLPGTRCQDAFMTASWVFLSSRTATTMIAPFTMD